MLICRFKYIWNMFIYEPLSYISDTSQCTLALLYRHLNIEDCRMCQFNKKIQTLYLNQRIYSIYVMFDRNYNIISQYLTSIRVQVVLFLTHHTYILNISFLIYVLITTKEESFCYLLDNESGVEMLIWTLNYHSI